MFIFIQNIFYSIIFFKNCFLNIETVIKFLMILMIFYDLIIISKNYCYLNHIKALKLIIAI